VSLIAFIRRNPSAGLLFTQLLGIMLYPWMEASPRGQTLLTIFGVIVLGVALRVVQRSPWVTWIALVLGIVIVLLSTAATISPQPILIVASATLEATFYFYATGSLIAYMVRDHVATTDEYYAAGATFTLLAWGFAYLFIVCQVLLPGSFSAPVDPQADRSWVQLLYLSVAVLSSVGLSDILPVTPMARSLVMVESFIGVMYIALVVSRLIGLSTWKAPRNQE
jgi:hypothetical protein